MKPSNFRGYSRAAAVWGLLLGGHAVALAQQYTISTVAGGAPPATPAGATSTSIGPPQRVTTDAAGNLYFTSLNSVFKVSTSGTLTLIAGNSRQGFAGDGGPAIQAQFNAPQGLAVDAAGDVFIADTGNNRVREVTADGVIHTVAGSGISGFYGSGGPATQAQLAAPAGVAVDKSGILYIADTGNHSIRKVTSDGVISQVAGNSYPGPAQDGGTAVYSNLFAPEDVAVDSKGVVYIADTGNAKIRIVDSNGNIQGVAGNGAIGIAGDSGAATSASLDIPYAVTVDASGNFYIADYGNDRIRMVTSKGIITTVVGNGLIGFSSDGSTATTASLNLPTGVAVDSSGNVYIADQWNLRVRKLSSGKISTVAGNGTQSYSGDGGPAALAQLNGPQGIAKDPSGNLYISDTRNAVIRKISAGGDISTLAGTSLVFPRGLASDASGNVYVADYKDNKVKRIAPDGTTTTVAGNGTAGFSGDGGAATSAMLHGPIGLAVDGKGSLYIADFSNNLIRQVSPAGVITTVAGNGAQGYSGDGQSATQASLNGPSGVATDAAGNLYIADTNNNVIREVTANGFIRTIAGTGVAGYAGDTGPPLLAQMVAPSGIAVDSGGAVYITDSARIRKIYPGSTILTIAGGGVSGYSGDHGLATLATVNGPSGLAVDAAGNLYVADTGNNAVRLLQPGAASITLQAVTHGATNLPGPVAPGEVVVLYGSGLGPPQLTLYQVGANGTVSTSLAGTRVLMGGIPAPILYTSPTQVGAVAPFGLIGSSVAVVAEYLNQATAPQSLAVVAANPGLFTLNYSGKGQAVAVNQTGQLNTSSSPAAVGSQLLLYASGLGQTSPTGTDGLLGTAPLPAAAQPVHVTIGGQPATVISATGVAGQLAGLMQVTVQVPAGITTGAAVPVTVQVGSATSASGVTVAVSP
ncbi:MAG: SMP-30/gluconolactonase/LRE family protein [Acidobacteriia bacterium]|nr:SMP-30/gluconolactonase/LRE family protein [Terriglobia bacterium]